MLLFILVDWTDGRVAVITHRTTTTPPPHNSHTPKTPQPPHPPQTTTTHHPPHAPPPPPPPPLFCASDLLLPLPFFPGCLVVRGIFRLVLHFPLSQIPCPTVTVAFQIATSSALAFVPAKPHRCFLSAISVSVFTKTLSKEKIKVVCRFWWVPRPSPERMIVDSLLDNPSESLETEGAPSFPAPPSYPVTFSQLFGTNSTFSFFWTRSPS